MVGTWQPTLATAVRICIQLKVFDKLAEANSPMNVDDLAKTTKADPKLLRKHTPRLLPSPSSGLGLGLTNETITMHRAAAPTPRNWKLCRRDGAAHFPGQRDHTGPS